MRRGPALPPDIGSCVRRALNEDIGAGDVTAELLPRQQAEAVVISREEAVLCGIPWFNEVYKQLDEAVEIRWHAGDGDALRPDMTVCTLYGPIRSLLTGERTALNFLQLLSGTATVTRRYADHLSGTTCRLLDTRKTLPGLRTAQKYAVACGGGQNHRMGLYDAILIKDNHIRAAGGIGAALRKAQSMHRSVEIEVESLEQLQEALDAGATRILLDNFDLETMAEAVSLNGGRAELEVSGGVGEEQLRPIAATGVDYISVGALTKHVRAVDFSMRVV